MNQTRQAVIAFHVQQALRLGTTMRSLAMNVSDLYHERTPAPLREPPLQQTTDPVADERHNTQVLSRWVTGEVRMPSNVEEAIVLALPEPVRQACQRELCARVGLLAAPLPSADGKRADVSTADVLRETGELLVSLAPAFTDGKLDASDLPHVRRALKECDDVLSAVTSMRAMLVSVLMQDPSERKPRLRVAGAL